MGLATLAKGPVGIALPLVAWAAARGALPPRPRRPGSAGAALIAVLALAVVVVPWLVLVQAQEAAFLRYAVVDETFLRLFSPSRFNRAQPPWYYLVTLTWARRGSGGSWDEPVSNLS